MRIFKFALAIFLTLFLSTSVNAGLSVTSSGGGAVATDPFDLTGGQIAFPATASPSSDPNTLDDYEEGTFTPTVEGSTAAGSGTYTKQKGFYVKVGNVVHFTVYVVWTALSGATGGMRVANLPFTCGTDADNLAGLGAGFVSNVTLTANNVLSFYTLPSTTKMDFAQTPVGGGAAGAVSIDTAGTVILGGSYLIL